MREEGILQGDRLSSLLFVLCMDSLSSNLNESLPMLSVESNGSAHACNHFLFIEDLKLLAKDESVLKPMVEESMVFLDTFGLEHNTEKSATNAKTCENAGVLLERPVKLQVPRDN